MQNLEVITGKASCSIIDDNVRLIYCKKMDPERVRGLSFRMYYDNSDVRTDLKIENLLRSCTGRDPTILINVIDTDIEELVNCYFNI